MGKKIRVTIWNENLHEQNNEFIAKLYPKGIHGAISDGLKEHLDIDVFFATLDEPEHGLTESVLNQTDVLIWWSHLAHNKVSDEIAIRVQEKVLDGMGLIMLHSTQGAKIFKLLLGTSGALKWRESGEKERIWVIEHGHPIADGLGEYFELEETEMYGEPFDIPAPDNLVFISWFPGGEVFRSGCCYYRGKGKVFYFRPGHETHPIYYDPNIRRVMANAVLWAKPTRSVEGLHIRQLTNSPPLERI